MKASLLQTMTIAAMLGACSGAGPGPTTPTGPVEPTATAAAPTDEPALPGEGEAPTADKLAPVDMHKAFVAALQAAWTERKMDELTALYAPAARIGMAGPAGWTEMTPAEAKTQLQGMMKAFPDGKMTPRRLISAGERAVLEWTFTGTNKGELMGEEATDKPVGVHGASFLLFDRDGKVKRENRYLDLTAIQGQLGKTVRGGKVRPIAPAPTAPLAVVIATREEEPKSVSLLKRYYQLTQTRDYPAIGELLADGAVISNNRDPADMTKADLVKLQPSADRAFIDEGSVVKACVNAGELGACEYEWTATLKRPAMGMPATGKRGMIHEADVAEVKEGKLVRVSGYGSRLEWFIAFGAMKPQAAAPATQAPPAE
ncbi:MAG: ester cyclase [Deltaproteobacteria bacterium]|nr:ester cyclase [Deltaproteobacteria bacterium]